MVDSCMQQKYEGNCVNNLYAMRFSCAKTCGLCQDSKLMFSNVENENCHISHYCHKE